MAHLWLEVSKLVVGTGATVAVAAWATTIASSQRKIAAQQRDIASAQRAVAHAKLNLDLFDRRYAIFDTTWQFLSQATKDASTKVLHSDFTNAIPRAEFLFGRQIADYMREASRNQTQLALIYLRTQKNADVVLAEDANSISELETWFYSEATTGCFRRFADYLDFAAWKIDPLDRLLSN
jgi:hypothetical protein